MATASMVAETVFDSATVDDSVPVATPLAFVVPIGCVRVFPVVGVAASTTVAPSIGLPFASRAVTVMVDVPLPAAIGDVAATVDWVAETAPTLTTTVAVCVMSTPSILADTVIVELPLPAVIGDVAVSVDRLAETVPAFTATVAVWVIAMALIVADT